MAKKYEDKGEKEEIFKLRGIVKEETKLVTQRKVLQFLTFKQNKKVICI